MAFCLPHEGRGRSHLYPKYTRLPHVRNEVRAFVRMQSVVGREWLNRAIF